TKQVTLKFRNAGSYVWRGAGKSYVSAYATGPYKRKSVFWHSDWSSRYQAGRLNEATVKSGQTGSVTITLHAPLQAGTYTEQFQLAVENVAWIYGSVARLKIEVVPEQVTAETPVNAKAYAVMDAATGEMLDAKNADDVRSIASITKLMTVMVAHDAGLDPDAIVALARADEVGGGRLRVPVGTSISVRDLVASAIVGSANNAANAIARATGLPREEFVARMDAKARALGMASSSFADPTGIEVENLSTAKEVALMGKAAFQDSWIAEFAAAPEYEVATAKGPHLIKNTNKLVSDAAVDVTAGKTGFINEAGYTLVTRLKREGEREVIVVVLGADTKSQSFRDAKVLAQKAWARSKTADAR
ncbi:MAG TPA: serine hydrolase, partial [Patescibacteria group bacterium]|nr:serine hydrolase [Patescibacteria group bacterium]